MEVRMLGSPVLSGAKFEDSGIGRFPVDWPIQQLGNIATIHDGTHQTPRYTPTGVPFYSVEQVTSNNFNSTKFISEAEFAQLSKSSRIEQGDVLMTRIGSIGDCRFVDWDVRAGYYVSLALLKFRDPVVARYFAHYSRTGSFKKEIDLHSLAHAIPKKINLGPISHLRLPVPPLAEQVAISDALSDADDLIDSLEQLLTKKRQIKQGAMQELLTGKRRLSGFVQEWNAQLLQDIAEMKSGEAITSEQLSDTHLYPCFGGNGLRGYAKSFTHEGQYALVGRQGALCGNVTLARGKFFASEHAVVVTPSASVDIVWLHYVLIRMNLNQYSESSAQPGLSVARLMQLNVLVPEPSEQTAIAQVLSDIDAEVTALESRLTKARAIKQSMAQALLTGRIRLPVGYQEPATLVTPRKGESALVSGPARAQESIA